MSVPASDPAGDLEHVRDSVLMREGDWVLLAVNDTKFNFVQLRYDAKYCLRSRGSKVSLDPLIGRPWGSFFKSVDSKLIYQPHFDMHQYVRDTLESLDGLEDDPVNARTLDNSKLFDDNTAQAMSMDSIMEMKHAGKSAKEILKGQMEGSSTYGTKTEFSKEKWVKKKLIKYDNILQAKRPTGRDMTEAWMAKSPSKILFLRHDTLAYIAHISNVRAGSTALVLDHTHGMVSGALCHQAQGAARIVQLETQLFHNVHAARYYNLNDEQMRSLSCVNLQALVRDKNKLLPQVEELSPEFPPHNVHTETDRVRYWAKEEGIQSIVIVTRLDPLAILDALWDYLAPGGNFVVYNQWIEPLADTQISFRACAGKVQLMEILGKPYQMLPNRTHPKMRADGVSGFILSGIKVKGPRPRLMKRLHPTPFDPPTRQEALDEQAHENSAGDSITSWPGKRKQDALEAFHGDSGNGNVKRPRVGDE